ncbi:membrane protein [Nesterenkonia sp. AN1]|uniref:Uncharacterized protein DUF421 n=1 Tax=Nesterenkonia aurantiaca TaxID=1436010 RepID=A0A4R7G3S5_9MICC|nr:MULTISPECIES: YetF domain-containing protein [Nesterenkonia]EXF23915.1 membrane protein [Nesterenkonia sp. AN1]TDS85836.1 uncharacterized protein DUF421 [Nesterenkonia aurantiaca]
MDMTQFWDGWDPIIHTVITLTAGYIALLIILRLSGPRTMASMTPLDFIVAVTIGSAFGRTLTAVDVPLSQAILTVLLLVLLQWIMAWLRGRSPKMRRLLDAPPVLIYYEGKFQRKALRKHQLVEDDIHTAVRSSSRGSLKEVSAVILEQNGGLVVIGNAELDDSSSVLKFTGDAEVD